jgi:hypothetical protein
MIHSYMTVQIIPGKETPTLPVGTSLLYAEEQCKEAKKLRLGGHKNKLAGMKSSSAAGIVIPGVPDYNPVGATVTIRIDEIIHVGDTLPALQPPK